MLVVQVGVFCRRGGGYRPRRYRNGFRRLGKDVPKGLEYASKTPALAAALRKKGLGEADVVIAGKFLRVMKQVIGN